MNAYDRRALERDIRKQILAVEDRNTQDVLFSLLALVHELAERSEVNPELTHSHG
jgi:hypothetical protein